MSSPKNSSATSTTPATPLADLDAVLLTFAADHKTAKVVKPTEADAAYIEAWEAEQIIDDLADTWRRKLWVAQILADRQTAA